MTRLRFLALLAPILACNENVAAPGACPEFCPTARLEIVDTVLTDVIVQDEWVDGYITPQSASILQVASQGTRELSRAIVRFRRFSSEFSLNNVPVPAEQTDSFRLRVPIRRWRDGVADLQIRVHRLPVTIDSAATYEELAPYFADSTLLTSFALPDSVPSDGVTVALGADAFPTLEADSFVTAIGIALTTADTAWVDVASREGSISGNTLTWYVQIDSSGTLVGRQQGQSSLFDSFLVDSVTPVASDVLVVGGTPSSRSFLRFALPESIRKFSTISQAELILVPAEPLAGVADDTVNVAAFGFTGDFGPKSRPEVLQTDSLARGTAELVVGHADTIRIDVTPIMKPWQADSTLPQTIVLLLSPEGGGLAELRVFSTRSAAIRPAVQITYVPFFSYEEPLE